MQPDLQELGVRSVNDLLDAEDERFVQLAYLSVLGRQADPSGLTGYLKRLRNGIAKPMILAELARSSEAQGHDMALPGLKELVGQYRGFFFRKLWQRVARLVSDDGHTPHQSIRAMGNALYRHELELFQKIDQLKGQLQNLTDTNRSLFAQLLEQQQTRAAVHAPQTAFGQTSPGHRIVFNLTTSRHWRARAVGIVRVERELASHLLNATPDTVFVAWDRETQSLRRLSASEIASIMSDRWLQASEPMADFTQLRTQFELEDTDIFVSLGLDWDLCPLHEMAATLLSSGCRSVFACHDIVPILFPEFCVEDHFDQRFKRHFVDMAHLADAVVCNSFSSSSDLQAFWRRAEIKEHLPATQPIRLANLRAPKRLPRLTESDHDRLRHINANSPYVLYVSSIEARKNHRLLLSIWRNLFRERGADCPTLVLVGMAGWGTRDLLEQMRRMPAYLADKIIVLNDVNDDFLLHLYSGCAFSVFPSHYEGWGLAATEALAFGKVCLIADAGGLAEATQGLMPQLHPLDFCGWQAQIEKLLDDQQLLQSLESRVRESFTHRSWADFSTDFVSYLHTIVRRQHDALRTNEVAQ